MAKAKQRGNGQGSVYKLPNGKWQAEKTIGYDLDGKRRSKKKSGFTTKKEALAWLESISAQKEFARKTVAQIYQSILPDLEKLSPSKQTAYRIAYHKLRQIHFRQISDLRTMDLQPLVDNIAGDFYPKRDAKALLKKIFDYALINDLCEKNYANYIKLPRCPEPKKDAFSDQDLDVFWAYYKNKHQPVSVHLAVCYALMMCYIGLRPGELLQAKKGNIHLHEQYMTGGIKTSTGKQRHMPLSEKILPVVKELYIATNDRLVQCCENAFYEQWWKMITTIGVRRLPPGCGRHTFNTLLALRGVQPAIIQKASGHKDYKTTLSYTHLNIDAVREAVNKL